MYTNEVKKCSDDCIKLLILDIVIFTLDKKFFIYTLS